MSSTVNRTKTIELLNPPLNNLKTLNIKIDITQKEGETGVRIVGQDNDKNLGIDFPKSVKAIQVPFTSSTIVVYLRQADDCEVTAIFHS